MKYFLTALFFLIALALFIILEYGRVTTSFNELLQPVIFSSVVAMIFLYGQSRRFISWGVLILFALMVVFYLAGSLFMSNWTGGLGMGIFVILTFSYLPKLIKNGHI